MQTYQHSYELQYSVIRLQSVRCLILRVQKHCMAYRSIIECTQPYSSWYNIYSGWCHPQSRDVYSIGVSLLVQKHQHVLQSTVVLSYVYRRTSIPTSYVSQDITVLSVSCVYGLSMQRVSFSTGIGTGITGRDTVQDCTQSYSIRVHNIKHTTRDASVQRTFMGVIRLVGALYQPYQYRTIVVHSDVTSYDHIIFIYYNKIALTVARSCSGSHRVWLGG